MVKIFSQEKKSGVVSSINQFAGGLLLYVDQKRKSIFFGLNGHNKSQKTSPSPSKPLIP